MTCKDDLVYGKDNFSFYANTNSSNNVKIFLERNNASIRYSEAILTSEGVQDYADLSVVDLQNSKNVLVSKELYNNLFPDDLIGDEIEIPKHLGEEINLTFVNDDLNKKFLNTEGLKIIGGCSKC